MTIDYAELVRNGIDVAGAINEVFLNKFSASHFQNNPGIYLGSQRFNQFENDIEIRYKLDSPIEFDFSSPIKLSRFRRLWLAHMKTKGGADSLTLPKLITVPPNLRLSVDRLIFEIVVYEGHTNNEIFKIDFLWTLEAVAAVVLNERTVNLEPLRVTFSTGTARIASQITARIQKWVDDNKLPMKEPHAATVGDPTDPVWCAKLEQLFLLLINQILATQLSNFIRTWELPRAIEIADGVAITPTYLGIQENDLVVGGQISTTPIGTSPLQAKLDYLIGEFTSKAEIEYSSMTDQELRLWQPDKSPTLKWMDEYVSSVQEETLKELRAMQQIKPNTVTPNVQLLFNDKLFDVLAKKYLSVNEGWNDSKALDRLVKGEIGWWFRVGNASGKVIPHGVEIHADVAIGAKAVVAHFDIDPKRFGKWREYGINFEIYPIPDFGIQALPSFSANGAYLSARLLTTGIGIRYLNWPSWANDLLAWVTGNLTRPLLSALASIIALFRIRILKFPHHFPGTGLEWTPNFDVRPSNLGPYLVFIADPDFK